MCSGVALEDLILLKNRDGYDKRKQYEKIDDFGVWDIIFIVN